MLKSIDVLIGLIVVLLALSMAVTVITQTITVIINSRGRHLRRGLTDLLQQLDPALNAKLSKAVATKILTHPLVSGSNTPMASHTAGANNWWASVVGGIRRIAGGPRLGTVIHREEFTKLLMGLADGTSDLDASERTALTTALTGNGIADPAATLKNIRSLALQLERSHPDLSTAARQNIAILQEGASDLVGKINNWFDQTMDRTSQRFTASTRTLTFVGAFVVAIGLQVDTPSLVNRLAADDALRAAFVNQATTLYADQQAQAAATSGGQATTAAPSSDEIARKYQSFLATNGIVKLPSEEGWWSGLKAANKFGLLITALLLTLGAPFWYNALGQLLQLRSVIAVKDDAQRNARQSTDPPPSGTATPTRPTASGVVGERGDLVAVG